ncbi:8184_t:CDS:2 [Racocetra fulgida]|uniref:8184_t:CDS:1 n=1 Tax=Racocetra fulgida TaxID=60492 RepID=A0A9N8W5F0_9GLOM|nr:8184_t:CDS:2 [Racocetra fulgida]
MIGLTGTYEQIAKVAKSYRVYFSRPPKVKPGDEYLVDHSIFFYLMDPNGQFVDAYGKNTTADSVTDSVKGHIKNFIDRGGVIKKLENIIVVRDDVEAVQRQKRELKAEGDRIFRETLINIGYFPLTSGKRNVLKQTQTMSNPSAENNSNSIAGSIRLLGTRLVGFGSDYGD